MEERNGKKLSAKGPTEARLWHDPCPAACTHESMCLQRHILCTCVCLSLSVCVYLCLWMIYGSCLPCHISARPAVTGVWMINCGCPSDSPQHLWSLAVPGPSGRRAAEMNTLKNTSTETLTGGEGAQMSTFYLKIFISLHHGWPLTFYKKKEKCRWIASEFSLFLSLPLSTPPSQVKTSHKVISSSSRHLYLCLFNFR